MTAFLPSDRTLRRNIWRALLSASDQEIHDGLSFYPGAHGLCRLFAVSNGSTPRQVAGIYAALSPMNGWETNVANTLQVLRAGRECALDVCLSHLGRGDYIDRYLDAKFKVNTSKPNRNKALWIAAGRDPLDMLKGRKVRAFFRAMADPDDDQHIPVDRHLICLAVGDKLSKNVLSRYAGSADVFNRLHNLYLDMGRVEGLGNRLASIAWFVQRRVLSGQSTQSLVPHPASPFCCSRPMQRFGRGRFYCPACHDLRNPVPIPRPRTTWKPLHPSEVQIDVPLPGPLSVDPRGRVRIYLRKGHPLANSAGWEYLSRWRVKLETGTLRTDEHVHHTNGNLRDCRRDNLEVWLAEHHGRHHARHQLLYMLRDVSTGRWVPSEVPAYSEQVQMTASDIPF